MPERRLGQFRLLQQIATGATAEVFLAVADGAPGILPRPLALKVFQSQFSDDSEFIRTLAEELRVAVQLHHPHVVETYDLGKVASSHYLALELVDGLDLFRLFQQAAEKKRSVPFPLAAYITAAVADGLDYAHQKTDSQGRPLEIVHRDVVPHNVLVGHNGDVKLGDFGLARVAGWGRGASTVSKGKGQYMAPEQALGEPVDGRSDIYAAGVLLYEMLTGQMLYAEEDVERLLDRVRKGNILPPSMHRSDVPDDLEAIVMKALKKRPQDRYQTAGEMSRALQDWLKASAPSFKAQQIGEFIVEVTGKAARPGPARPAQNPKAARSLPLKREGFSVLQDLEPEESARSEASAKGGSRPAGAHPARASEAPRGVAAGLASSAEAASPGRAPAGRPAAAPKAEAQAEEAEVSPEELDAVEEDAPAAAEEEQPVAVEEVDAEPIEANANGTMAAPVTPLKRPSGNVPVRSPWPKVMVGGRPGAVQPRAEAMPAGGPSGPTEEAIASPPMAQAAGVAASVGAQPVEKPLPIVPLSPPVEVEPATTSDKGSSGGLLKWVLLGVIVLGALGAGGFVLWQRLQVQAFGTIDVVSVPPGATVRIDGQPVAGRTPVHIEKVNLEGTHRLTVDATGYQPWEREVSFEQGERGMEVQAVLSPFGGSLHVVSQPPGAEVVVNGRVRGQTPLDLGNLSLTEDVVVEVKLAGYRSEKRTLVWAGQTKLDLALELAKARH
ncbi:MAG TPA: protein kinase [Polyangia bacterium]|nr:protein kinase [Polyangia bacterium]